MCKIMFDLNLLLLHGICTYVAWYLVHFGPEPSILHENFCVHPIFYQYHSTSSTAQGGGGSFRIGNL
jgi:hypothetical protein